MGSYTDKTFKPTEKLILEVFDNHQEALVCEIALHNAFDVARNQNFANRAKQTSTGFSSAGVTYTLSIETRKKISESKMGEKNPRFGKKLSKQTRDKLSKAHMGKKVSDETRRRLSESHMGKTPTELTRRKLSDAHKGYTHTLQTKLKISKAHNGDLDLWQKNYFWIKKLHIETGWGRRRICKAYNKEFCAGHCHTAFGRVLEKIKTEIAQEQTP
jgi:hypothetical protein